MSFRNRNHTTSDLFRQSRCKTDTFVVVACILIAAMLLAFACNAHAAPMPWKTFGLGESAMVNDTVRASMGVCPQGEILVGKAHSGDAGYILYFAAETNRIIFAYYASALDAAPTEIGFGSINPEKHDDVPPLLWIPFNAETHVSPCSYLFDSGA